MKSPREKVTALFLDGANLHFIQKKLGWEIDFEKLYNHFAKETNLYNAFYYTAVDKDSATYTESQQFLDNLSFVGYTVRTKDIKIIRAGFKEVRKGNLDIEIVIDMFNTKDLYDRAILFSGDSDFERALELLRTYGKEIEVVSSRGFVARELLNAADKYQDLAHMRTILEKTKSVQKPQHSQVQKTSSTQETAKVTTNQVRTLPKRPMIKRTPTY